VGTARRPLVVVDPAGRRLVGPDNGLFTPFLGAGARAYRVTSGPALPAPASATFHGRDLFAPAAALLAGGTDPAALGPPVADPVRLDWPTAERRADGVHGVALVADAFGNLLTSIREADLPAGPLRAEVGGLPARVVRTYGEARPGELVALVGSSGRLEVAVREGSAAALLGGGRGTALVIRGPA
jgi:S-adenosylmethionine hydrolase